MRVVQEVKQQLPNAVELRFKEDHRYLALQRHRLRNQWKQERLTHARIYHLKESLTWLSTGSKSNLSWFGGWFWSGVSKGWIFSAWIVLTIAFGATIDANIPDAIYCKTPKSFCYLLRWNKTSIVLPSTKKSSSLKNVKLQRHH